MPACSAGRRAWPPACLAAGETGVVGTRMIGGGFGGCTLTLVEAARAEAVMAAVAAGYRRGTGRDCTLFTTRPAAGARLLKAAQ